jgi:uncharacterized protein YjbJ (UPF0337 family)
MTHLVIQSDWKIAKSKLKQKWTQLTDDDLPYPAAGGDELIERLQQRTGESREAVETAVRNVSRTSSESMYERFLSRTWLSA